MSELLTTGNDLRAKTIIWRVGDAITIKRPDGSETENIFGKKDDTDITFSTVSSDEYGYRYDPSRTGEEQAGSVPGGRVNTHQPHVALALDTQVQQYDLIEFPNGDQYHVTHPVSDEGSYAVARTNLYQQ